MILPGIPTRKDFVKIINDKGYKRAVEIGVCQGLNASWLLDNSNLEVLYGVENWSVKGCRKCREETEEKMAAYGSRFVWKLGNSSEIVNDFENESLDFVYIDGNHRYGPVNRDIHVWYPKVKTGGFFGGHDYVETKHCGVIKAVDNFFANIGREFFVTDEDQDEENISFWMIK